jgi:hypothetical protein
MWGFMTLTARIPDAAGPFFRKPRVSSTKAELETALSGRCTVTGSMALVVLALGQVPGVRRVRSALLRPVCGLCLGQA